MCPEARTLRCPHCGAAADPDARRCPYCSARLATVSCPGCFAKVFDGTRFCPACGAAAGSADLGPSDAPCPACGAALHRVEVGGSPLLECGACDGVWVDAPVFEALCADRAAQPPVLHHFAASRAARPDPAGVKYRPCVRCAKLMNRMNFGKASGTIVDVCRGHGTFLDAGELHAILTFIQGGGLEAARAREMQDLKEERRRLESERMRTRAPRPGARATGYQPDARWDAGSVLDLLKRITR